MSNRRGTRGSLISPLSVRVSRTARLVSEAESQPNIEEVVENIRINMHLNSDLPDYEQESLSSVQDTNVQIRVELWKECQSEAEKLELRANISVQEVPDAEKEQLRRDLRASAENLERIKEELNKTRKLLEDKTKADEERQRVCMLNRIQKMMEKDVHNEQNAGDDRSSESESEYHDVKCDEGDVTDQASRYCIADRELNGSRRNPYCESVEKDEDSSEEVGSLSWLPDAVGNYKSTICERGAASFSSVPSAARRGNGRNGGQSEKCPICLCEFGTQEIGTPECCNHSFCVDCLQEWSENSNICPLDREVYDAILVRCHLGGEIIGRIRVRASRQQVDDDLAEYIERCEVCRDIGFSHELIFCNRCGQGYHMECVCPPVDTFPFPIEEWFCRNCSLSPSFYVDYEE
jgi:hypothetical protein